MSADRFYAEVYGYVHNMREGGDRRPLRETYREAIERVYRERIDSAFVEIRGLVESGEIYANEMLRILAKAEGR